MNSTSFDDRIEKEFSELQREFPSLLLEKMDSSYLIFGSLAFRTTFKSLEINDLFSLKIKISECYPNALPIVEEIGERIPSTFHRNPDMTLCLGVPLDLRIKFSQDPCLLGFIKSCVLPYLCSFIYYKEKGIRPEGELDHGGAGVIQFYYDFLNITDLQSLIGMLKIIEKNYGGHHKCPCNSGLKVRECHGPKLLEIKNVMVKKEFDHEFNQICRFLEELRTSYQSSRSLSKKPII